MKDPDIRNKMSIMEYAMQKLQQEDRLQKLSNFEKNRIILKYLKLTESLSPHIKVAKSATEAKEKQRAKAHERKISASEMTKELSAEYNQNEELRELRQ
jgi:hypothetical protein